MKTILSAAFGIFCFLGHLAFGQVETPPECTNLEQIQQRIGYPLEAKRAGVHGKVLVSLTVSPSGKVEKSEVVESPSPMLSDAVLAHTADLKFKPAKMDGKPIKSIVQLPINFETNGEPKVFYSLEEALTTTEVVEILDLSGQKLSTLDKRIARLKSLRRIILDDNEFSSVPSVLGKLTSLETIEIAGNQIKTIPGFLKKLKGLQEIDISNNPMSEDAIKKARELLEDVDIMAN